MISRAVTLKVSVRRLVLSLFCILGVGLVGITAKASPTACDTYTLLNTLSEALKLEEIAERDIDPKTPVTPSNWGFEPGTDSDFLQFAQDELDNFESLLTNTACAVAVGSATVDFCMGKISEARSLDEYLENVLFRKHTSELRGERFPPTFIEDRPTQLNLLRGR